MQDFVHQQKDPPKTLHQEGSPSKPEARNLINHASLKPSTQGRTWNAEPQTPPSLEGSGFSITSIAIPVFITSIMIVTIIIVVIMAIIIIILIIVITVTIIASSTTSIVLPFFL